MNLLRIQHSNSLCDLVLFSCTLSSSQDLMHCTLSLTVCKCTPCQRASFNSTTDSFSWGHDPYTLACKARPSSDRCWTSLSVSLSLPLSLHWDLFLPITGLAQQLRQPSKNTWFVPCPESVQKGVNITTKSTRQVHVFQDTCHTDRSPCWQTMAFSSLWDDVFRDVHRCIVPLLRRSLQVIIRMDRKCRVRLQLAGL